jgi:hypothetical protein
VDLDPTQVVLEAWDGTSSHTNGRLQTPLSHAIGDGTIISGGSIIWNVTDAPMSAPIISFGGLCEQSQYAFYWPFKGKPRMLLQHPQGTSTFGDDNQKCFQIPVIVEANHTLSIDIKMLKSSLSTVTSEQSVSWTELSAPPPPSPLPASGTCSTSSEDDHISSDEDVDDWLAASSSIATPVMQLVSEQVKASAPRQATAAACQRYHETMNHKPISEFAVIAASAEGVAAPVGCARLPNAKLCTDCRATTSKRRGRRKKPRAGDTGLLRNVSTSGPSAAVSLPRHTSGRSRSGGRSVPSSDVIQIATPDSDDAWSTVTYDRGKLRAKRHPISEKAHMARAVSQTMEVPPLPLPSLAPICMAGPQLSPLAVQVALQPLSLPGMLLPILGDDDVATISADTPMPQITVPKPKRRYEGTKPFANLHADNKEIFWEGRCGKRYRLQCFMIICAVTALGMFYTVHRKSDNGKAYLKFASQFDLVTLGYQSTCWTDGCGSMRHVEIAAASLGLGHEFLPPDDPQTNLAEALIHEVTTATSTYMHANSHIPDTAFPYVMMGVMWVRNRIYTNRHNQCMSPWFLAGYGLADLSRHVPLGTIGYANKKPGEKNHWPGVPIDKSNPPQS